MPRIKNADVLAQLQTMASLLAGGQAVGAQAATATAASAVAPAKAPKPLIVTVETIAPEPGKTFRNGSSAPFKVIKIDNGANGSYNRSKTLDRRYALAFLAFLGVTLPQADALLTSKGL